ncbi:MAG TPA: efflux RND transporter periplasmic adaptor subunit [Gemmatimonadaceae bacterium]|nr:efflux RND transporter periplasmic adaptor subunit [Gemmatimonadaceae bacterium]
MYVFTRAARATIGLVFAVSVAACGRQGADAAPATATSAVNIGPEAIAVVAMATLSSGPAVSGTLVAERTATIRAEVSGPVLAVLSDPGVRVAKGALLARVDDTAIRDAWLSAKSGVTQAQLAADLATREEQRAERLLQAGAIAENALEAARRVHAGARAQLDDAKARLSAAQQHLDNTVIKAPYDGVVSERQVNAGDVVSPGMALFTVVDPSTMRLEGAVSADQLGAVRVGSPVRFAVTGYPGRTFEGAITHLYPSADPQTRQVRLFARIPNAGRDLVAGLYATGRVASTTRQALTAPLAVVDQRGIKPVVTRLRNGKAERVEVTLGLRDEATERVELTSGVAPGDTLLVGAAQGITPGTPVTVSAVTDRPAATKR